MLPPIIVWLRSTLSAKTNRLLFQSSPVLIEFPRVYANTVSKDLEGKNDKDLYGNLDNKLIQKDICTKKLSIKKPNFIVPVTFSLSVPDLTRFKRLLSFQGCRSYISKGKAGK